MRRFLIPCILAICLFPIVLVNSEGSVHKCVHSSTKLAKRGRGNTETSCMGCNPAMPACSSGCQNLIDKLYINCDNVCLPDGYYFDPQWELQGCWKDNIKKVKIKVERCGCNLGYSSKFSVSLLTILLFGVVVFRNIYCI
jgi:hypothetical protein